MKMKDEKKGQKSASKFFHPVELKLLTINSYIIRHGFG